MTDRERERLRRVEDAAGHTPRKVARGFVGIFDTYSIATATTARSILVPCPLSMARRRSVCGPMRTTRPAPLDYTSVFPELADAWRTTIRLHPRPGVGVLADRSKMGSPIVWPEAEAWPRCTSAECDCGGGALVPVLQLRREDVLPMRFPDDTDLFQLLWCPHDPGGVGPFVRAFWRASSTVMLAARQSSPSAEADANLVPRPCELHPESVRELPSIWELPKELRDRIWAYDEARSAAGDRAYQYLSSVAPGTKVGGHVSWIQDPAVPACARGHAMQHLLTIASMEFDGGSWPRWCAIEDDVWGGPYEARMAVQGAANIMLGDMGSQYVFVCRQCPEYPIETVAQCS